MAREEKHLEICGGLREHIRIKMYLHGPMDHEEKLKLRFRVTDSTIAPPPNRRFCLTIFSWLLDTRKDAMETMSSCMFWLAKDYRTMSSGWQGAPYSWIRPGGGLKTSDFINEKLGGLL